MMDNIYEEYESMEDFKIKALQGHHPSLGHAVDNSVVYIMDENLRPKEVYPNIILCNIKLLYSSIEIINV